MIRHIKSRLNTKTALRGLYGLTEALQLFSPVQLLYTIIYKNIHLVNLHKISNTFLYGSSMNFFLTFSNIGLY